MRISLRVEKNTECILGLGGVNEWECKFIPGKVQKLFFSLEYHNMLVQVGARNRLMPIFQMKIRANFQQKLVLYKA